jgi:hypothetical protein
LGTVENATEAILVWVINARLRKDDIVWLGMVGIGGRNSGERRSLKGLLGMAIFRWKTDDAGIAVGATSVVV